MDAVDDALNACFEFATHSDEGPSESPSQEEAVVSLGLDGLCLESSENQFDGVDRLKNRTDRVWSHWKIAAPHLSEDVFRGVRHSLHAGETEEAARTLDGMDRSKDALEDLEVVRVGLELHNLLIKTLEVLVTLYQKFIQQIVHCLFPDVDNRGAIPWREPHVDVGM